jgi:hypothetical protein
LFGYEFEYHRRVIEVTAGRGSFINDGMDIGGAMLRSAHSAIAPFLSFLRVPLYPRCALALPAIALFLLLTNQGALAQCKDCGAPALNILGAHNDYGRGCVGCHIRRVESGSQAGGVGSNAMWEENASYDKNVLVAQPAAGSIAATNSEDTGILLCVSCHDGSLAQGVGLWRQLSHRRVPTLFVGGPGGFMGTDHPLGPAATIEVGNGLQFANGVFSVIPGTPYAQFVATYGWPSLERQGPNHYGINQQGRPYLICTTCHDPHEMSVYHSRAASRIAEDDGDQSYPTAFFVNGPYNNVPNLNNRNAASSVQFCRQCHFHLTNEANNAPDIRTEF